MAILLTDKDDLSPSVKEFLNNSSYSKSYIIGGNGVVSDKIASQLKNNTRLGGTSRYSTNAAILNQFANEFNYNKVYIASGENYPDALSGSVLAASNNSPLILVGASVDPSVISSIKAQHDKYNNIVVLAGTAVVSDALTNNIVSGVFIPSISDDEIKKLIYNADQTYVNIHPLAAYGTNEKIRNGNTDYYKLNDDVNTYDKLFKYYNTYFSEKKSNSFINTTLFINSNNTFYIASCNPGERPLILQSKIENNTISGDKINVTLLCCNNDEPNNLFRANFTLIYENGRWLADDWANYDWNDFTYRDNHNVR